MIDTLQYEKNKRIRSTVLGPRYIKSLLPYSDAMMRCADAAVWLRIALCISPSSGHESPAEVYKTSI